MPSDYAYDYALRGAGRAGPMPYRREGRARRPRPWTYGRSWSDVAGLEERMGLHDMTEHYGRYSGGDPYSYEYSERSIEHRHPAAGGYIGFTRGFDRTGAPGVRHPRDYERAPSRRSRTGIAPWPRQAWEAYERHPRPEAGGWRPMGHEAEPRGWHTRGEAEWPGRRASGPHRGRDRYRTLRGSRYRD